MADTVLSNFVLGSQANGGSRNSDYDVRYANSLKLWSGEVFNAFNNASIAKGLVRSYSLRGKSKQFMFTGKLAAGYHTPGESIVGDAAIKANEKTIVMDGLLTASQFTYELDELLTHVSLRSEISKQIGEALAKHYDERISAFFNYFYRSFCCYRRARWLPGSLVLAMSNAQALVDGFFEAAAVLDERSAPAEGRRTVLNPRQYYSLISSVDTNILNREIGNTQGDMNSGKVSTALLVSRSRRATTCPS